MVERDGKRFSSTDEIIDQTYTYFKDFQKSSVLEGMLKLEERWTNLIDLIEGRLCWKSKCLFWKTTENLKEFCDDYYSKKTAEVGMSLDGVWS